MTRQRELRPVRAPKAEQEKVERRIRRQMKEKVYGPLMDELASAVGSGRSPLLSAVERGTVTFDRGAFSGSFTAAITRELKAMGAAWDRRTSTFRLRLSAMPPEVREAVTGSEARFLQRLASIDRRLAQILPEEVAETLKVKDLFSSALWKVDRDLRKTLIEGITVPPKLTKTARERIAAEWQQNMALWIKDFAAEEITKLRRSVQRSAFAGNRYEAMVKTIQRSYGVTERKAKFLARQETNLLVAKFKETRYAEAGVSEYRWRCVAGSPAHPVRPAHRALDGKVFRFDSPPVTTEPGEPQRRNNPGQDYGCRCVALPLARFK